MAEKAAIAAAIVEKVFPLIAKGAYRPVMDEIFPLAEASKAHAHMDASAHVGKIVLVV